MKRYDPLKVERWFQIIEEEIEDEEARLEEEGIVPPRLSIHLKRAIQELKAHLSGEKREG